MLEPVAVLTRKVRAFVDRVHLVDANALEAGRRLLDRIEQARGLAVREWNDQLCSRTDVVEYVVGSFAVVHSLDVTQELPGRIRSPVVSEIDFVPASSVPVRPAATVMLVRDGSEGLEVFMLQRTMSAAFAKGQFVFPGGKVDDADHGDAFEPICDGLDDATASTRMGMDHGGLAWLVAAIRECFEEAGVLLARPVDGYDIVRFEGAEVEARFNTAAPRDPRGNALARRPVRQGALVVARRSHSPRRPLDHARR